MEAPTSPSRGWQVADGLWALLFSYAAFVNLNDPDPLIWLGLYGAGAIAAALDIFGQLRLRLAAMLSGLYALGALLVASQGMDTSHPMQGFPQYGIFREEVVRESLGLGLVALWLGVLAVRMWRQQRAQR